MAKRNSLKDKILGRHRPNTGHREMYRAPTYERSPQRQSKGTLRAKYGQQDNVWRIAYVANGFWQLQKFVDDMNFPDKRTYHSWLPYARPTSYDTAMTQLQRKDHQLERTVA